MTRATLPRSRPDCAIVSLPPALPRLSEGSLRVAREARIVALHSPSTVSQWPRNPPSGPGPYVLLQYVKQLYRAKAESMEGSWQEFWTRRRLTVSGVGLVLLVGVASCAVMGMGNAPGARGLRPGRDQRERWARALAPGTRRHHHPRALPAPSPSLPPAAAPRGVARAAAPLRAARVGSPGSPPPAPRRGRATGARRRAPGGRVLRGPRATPVRPPGRRLRIEPGRRWRRSRRPALTAARPAPLPRAAPGGVTGGVSNGTGVTGANGGGGAGTSSAESKQQRREWHRRRCQQQLRRRGRHGHRRKR